MPLTITYNHATNDYTLGGGTFTALQYRGEINAYANPLYPKATKGDFWRVRVAGKMGGASGDGVLVGQYILATADAETGTASEVGASWEILEASALQEHTIADDFAYADLSTLPTADPGGGKPWLNGGVVQVGP